jgi:hypothetical protein
MQRKNNIGRQREDTLWLPLPNPHYIYQIE